jgi:DNA-binding transcriptional LysR family regulator
MKREEMADLTAFLVVAEERSFTRAAAKLGMTQSALSQIVRRLEKRLGLRLLSRTTRSVAPSEAGERLLETLAPALANLDASLVALSALRDKPAGTIRITTVEHAAKLYIWPALKKILPAYPDVHVEITLDYGLVDIVAERYDAGVRLGEQVAQDMIAIRISPDIPMAIVGTEGYFEQNPAPRVPQDLVAHRCINLRVPTSGGLTTWAFENGGRKLKVRTAGPLVFNTLDLILDAALNGFGLAYLPLDLVQGYLETDRLKAVLTDWSAPLSGYHLYYPSRRQHSPAFELILDALRYRIR